MEDLKYSEILRQNNELKRKVTSEPFKVSVLSNITVNALKEILEYNLLTKAVRPDIRFGNYDNIVQDSATCDDARVVIIFQDILKIQESGAIYFEAMENSQVEQLENKIKGEIDLILSNLKNVPAVIFNKFSSAGIKSSNFAISKLSALVGRLNEYLESKRTRNLELFDLDKVIGRLGVSNAIDKRMFYSSQAPYTLTFFKSYVANIQPVFLRLTGKLKKAIIFDCDNTLWKGVVGEDGLQGIDMNASSAKGKPYNEVQSMAAFLSKKGVIVGLCSKNNSADVDEVLKNHPDMRIKDDHLVIKKVNWTDKATNLREIAAELNIGIDSIVFVDDSPFEINLIKEQIPELVTFQVPAAIHEFSGQFADFVFNNFDLSDNEDDQKRVLSYKQQIERKQESASYENIEEYLSSLEISLDIRRNDLDNIPRIAQLTQKTNQFNLSTIRYSETEIEQLMKATNAEIFSVSVKDKFGDSGLTAVSIIRHDKENQKAMIDSFLMSCRVIGRNIETYIANFIIEDLKTAGYKTVTANYIPTPKNSQVVDFYEKLGFSPSPANNGSKNYSLELKKYKSHTVKYINAVTSVNK